MQHLKPENGDSSRRSGQDTKGSREIVNKKAVHKYTHTHQRTNSIGDLTKPSQAESRVDLPNLPNDALADPRHETVTAAS